MSEWQDISTAPKDGTKIRLLVETDVIWQTTLPKALVSGGWRRVSDADKVVGWWPIPEPPVTP